MHIAHLILAHKAPTQLERLVRKLAHSEADVFIHLDRKIDYQPFAPLAALPRVHFIRHRLVVKWGGYSLTRATLESMREILGAPVRYDFINLLSGEDYPIKPVGAIHEFLAQHLGQSFLECQPDSSEWWQANQSRFNQYHLTEFNFRGQYVAQRLLNRMLPRRKSPLFSTLYGGNMGGWYTISRACAAYVVAFVDAHPRLRRYARYTWGSDEFLVHSILLNSPLAATIVNNNLRYIDWSGGGSNPKILTTDDLGTLQDSARLYARKFDASHSAHLLAELDELTGASNVLSSPALHV